jgi:hypothetical protein
MMYQQGDVLIKKVKSFSGGKKLDHLRLAEGEATGHAHKVSEGKAELYEKDGIMYLRVNSDTATVTHEEHKEIELSRGDYEINIVQEYDHFEEEARNVVD